VPEWIKKSREVRDMLEISQKFTPLTGSRRLSLQGVPKCLRVREVLNVSEAVRLRAGAVLQIAAGRFGSSLSEIGWTGLPLKHSDVWPVVFLCLLNFSRKFIISLHMTAVFGTSFVAQLFRLAISQ
jgi:hypothetical protein